MTSSDIVMIIAALIPLIAAIGSVVAAIIAAKARSDIRDVHQTVNSRMEELIDSTATASHARGLQEGVGAVIQAAPTIAAITHPTPTPPHEEGSPQ